MALEGRIDADRARAGVLTALVVTAIGSALVAGLDVKLPVRPAEVMKLFAVPVPPPPPHEKPPPPRPHQARKAGASAPPNLRSKATPVVAPRPVVPPIQPPPIAAAPVPSIGVQSVSGAALVAGPGTGAGGQGNGTGSGRSGTGGGAGGTPVRQISPGLRPGDLPRDARNFLYSTRGHYVVGVRFTVGTDGRPGGCTVTQSSGNAALDAGTCEATVRKIRFAPERDSSGRPVAVTLSGPQEWTFERGEPAGDDDQD